MPDLRKFVANDEQTGTMLAELAGAFNSIRPEHVRIATAYLTPNGFLAIQGGMERAKTVRLLLGERPFFSRLGPTDVLQEQGEELDGPVETISWFDFLEGNIPWILMNHEERKALLQAEGEDAFKKRRDFNIGAWHKIRELVRFIEQERVEVRRFLGPQAGKVLAGKVLEHGTAPKIHLHAKAYILRGAEASYTAIGSSNLTMGGLQGNIEGNLVSTDPEVVKQVDGWFDRKWEQGQDCRDEMIRRLEECVLFGRRFSPWQVFLKALHTAYGRFLGFGLSEELADRLAKFQAEGVTRAVELLEKHWGAMICDSVGLGKTYTGLGILGEYLGRRETKGKALIVCPAQLENNWSIEKLRAWGIPGETVSMESLVRFADLEEVEDPAERRSLERSLRRLQEYDIVLVDESHNFRNPGTKRYRGLMEVIRGGSKADKRVLLLTATPINNSLWDLYHQLMLITRGDNSWYSGRGPVGNLEGTFRSLEKVGGGTGLLDTMLLTLVRRTRHDIRQRQDAGEPFEINGKALVFPDHKIPKAITYSLEALYEGVYRQVIENIEDLNFAVYNLEAYGLELKDPANTEERKRAIDRNQGFIGIIRTTYLKRMESSVAALRNTLKQQVSYLDLFLKLLEDGKVLRPKDRDRLKVILGGSLSDDLIEEYEFDTRYTDLMSSLQTADRKEYDNERLAKDVAADRDALRGLQVLLDELDAKAGGKDDPKIQALKKSMEAFPATDAYRVPTKVVIFTNYKDTAHHIFKMLGGPALSEWQGFIRTPVYIAGRECNLSLLTGADDKKRRMRILEHFAPLASFREYEDLDDPGLQEKIAPIRKESIEILIATDVLSEGQNLQDAQYLINYDLHWNPVRMIQRAGRIDRLFSPHEEVYIHNMMPEKGLEELLNLVSRLQKRVKAIDATLGLDASVLGEQIEARALDQLMAIRQGGTAADQVYREGEKKQGFDDALEQLKDYVELVRSLGTEEVAQVPDGIYSVKKGKHPGVFIMLKMPDEFGGEVFWRFYPAEGSAAISSAVEVARRIAAERDELRADLPDDVNPFLQLEAPLRRTIEEMAQEYRRLVSAQDPGKLVQLVRNKIQSIEVEEAVPELVAKFAAWCCQPHPDDLLRREDQVQEAYRALKVTATTESTVKGLKVLWAALEAKGLDRPLPRPATREPSERDLQLICWEWVIPEDKPPIAKVPHVVK